MPYYIIDTSYKRMTHTHTACDGGDDDDVVLTLSNVVVYN